MDGTTHGQRNGWKAHKRELDYVSQGYKYTDKEDLIVICNSCDPELPRQTPREAKWAKHS